jgi:methyl-accepting chemotaxis protein
VKSLSKVKHWPLRFKIVLLLFLSSVLPLAIMGIIEFYHARAAVLHSTSELLVARGDEVAGKLDAFNDRYRRAAARLTAIPDVVRYAQSPAVSRRLLAPAVRGILDPWLRADSNFRGVAILDATGVALLGTEESLVGRNLAEYRYVREALQGVPVISDLHLSGNETGGVPSIAYLAPIDGGHGRVAGVVVFWVRASAFWKVVAEGNEKAGTKSFSVLFDQFGVRIAHSYSADIVFHPGGRLDSATLEAMVNERRFGDRTRELLEEPKVFPQQFDLARSASPNPEVFRGFAPVNETWNIGVPRRLATVPWTLFYMIPEKSLDAPVADLLQRIVLLTVAAMGFAILAGVLVSRGIVGSVRMVSEAAQSLGACASQLTASVTQIAAATSQSATAVSETTSTIEEVKQTAQLSTQKARNVADSAQKAAQVSQTGQKAAEESVDAMKRIQDQMELIAESIVRLSEQSQAIGEIMLTVNDLAEQSNLLAVNASIEAAKAGDQGKGFGVVAQEVRSLAEQSKQATAQVRSILSDIQKATNTAVMATEQGSKTVEAGVKQSAQTGESVQQLAESVAEAAQAATQIAASSQQQMAGLDQVAQAMESIKAASAQNVASTKQTEIAATNIGELGRKLTELVALYKV